MTAVTSLALHATVFGFTGGILVMAIAGRMHIGWIVLGIVALLVNAGFLIADLSP